MPSSRRRVFRVIFSLGTGAENDEGIAVFDAHKAFVLKRGEDGTPVAEFVERRALARPYFNWKKNTPG